jgi:hypothetical protein
MPVKRPSSTTPCALSDCRLIVWSAPTSGRAAMRPSGPNEVFARKVIYAAFLQPKRDIAAPVTPRHAPGPSGGQEDDPCCHCKVFGNLAPGLSTSDHQNRPGGKRVWTAVARRVDLQQAWRKRLRYLRSARAVQAAAGDNHGARREFAGRRDEAVDAGFPVVRERCYRRVGRHRKAAAPRIVLQESDEFVARVKSLMVRSFVTVTRHHRPELRRVQMEGVPALGEPSLADPPALQHAV